MSKTKASCKHITFILSSPFYIPGLAGLISPPKNLRHTHNIHPHPT